MNRGTTHTSLIFALILAVSFMDIMDFGILQVAIPTIQSQLTISLADSQWILGAYGITAASFLMLSGRAGDLYGQKRIFVAGTVLFTVASLAAGLSPSFLSLVVFRLVQGIGAAMSTVTAFAIFIGLFQEGRERNKYYGIFIAAISSGFATGSLAGGALTVLFGWRSVLFVNVPIGLVAIILAQKFLYDGGHLWRDRRLDLPGSITVTAGLILFVYALTNAAKDTFASILTLLPLALSFVVLGGFLALESRSKSPLMPLWFLKRGSVLDANIICLLFASTAAVPFLLTIYFQTVLGYSALYSGLGILPVALTVFVMGGWAAAKILNRLGARRTLLGASLLLAAGSALLTQIAVGEDYLGILPGTVVFSIGAALGFPAINALALAGTKPGEEGLASGLINTSFRVGLPVGIAVLLAVAGVFDPPSPGAAAYAALSGLVMGFRFSLAAATLVGLICFFLALRIREPSGSTHPAVE
ncbi:MAG TPA: MFS transporter [Candidatus Bathyarchaeia archaeon]|nr:MFS transporter [Candidatus Bathyarchaeia archaeon]